MEFDCATGNYSWKATPFDATLFEAIRKKYEQAGYKIPRIAFWNILSRSNTIPMTENDLGVALISGFSPALFKMVVSNKLDPREALIDAIMDERYNPVGRAITRVFGKDKSIKS